MPKKYSLTAINTRLTVVEEHISTLNKEMGEVAEATKEIKTALIGDLNHPETMENSLDKRLSKIEQTYKIIIALIIIVIPLATWLVDKVI